MIIGYTTGVFDLFHIGHLNILKNAKSVCDKLIVGVTTDEFVRQYKNKKTTIPYKERAEIVRSIKYVDSVIPQNDHNKFNAWKKLNFDIMIVGDDWFNTDEWNKYNKQFSAVGVKIIYFPRTSGLSTSLIKDELHK
ncbi:MAG: adenylyltransferase/cytidyltransferase family protein [Mariniphaga sp.]|nr:adenylyltransferase/cytidyltransferase family protein [Mariniphaga sp.]